MGACNRLPAVSWLSFNLLLLLPVFAWGEPFPPDPVKQFRDALKTPVLNAMNPVELDFRRANLQKLVPMLPFAAMPGALGLQEWRDDDREESVAAIDRAVRKELIVKFEKAARGVLEKGSPQAKLAVVFLIGEMGVKVRGAEGRAALASDLAGDLAPLLQAPAGSLRDEAARALGKVTPPPRLGTEALGQLLFKGDLTGRRAAAEGLTNLVRVLLPLAKGGSRGYAAEIAVPKAIETARLAAVTAGRGLTDSDAAIRRACLETIQLAALTLGDLVREGPRLEFPPPGRKPTAEEEQQITTFRKDVERERAELLPLAEALNSQVPAVIKALADADTTVSRGACAVLEALPPARQHLQERVDSVPRLESKAAAGKLAIDPFPALKDAAPGLAPLVSHKDLEVRLAALYALESLEVQAAPAVDAIVKALKDDDPFVRWAAVRALGKMAPLEAEKAVPGLAVLIEDPNGDVRITTLAALERYGPAATAAIPALCRAVNARESEMRLWAIRALVAIGTEARPAIPALVSALNAPEYQVRLAAASALGKFGPAGAAAVEALLKVAGEDPESAVRQAASSAVLAIK